MLDFARLSRALERRSRALSVFFRDDDGGWANERLVIVSDLVSAGVHVDLAVIPMALTTTSIDRISLLLESSSGLLDIHQHGFCHANHERLGRKCEFGASRSLDQQQRDITHGVSLLVEAFGDHVRPIFTPPWNRCNQETIQALLDTDIRILSRDRTAQPLSLGALTEVPVRVDWLKRRQGARLNGVEFTNYLTEAIETNDTLGIMLHHAEMDLADRVEVLRLIDVLASTDLVEFVSLEQVARRMGEQHGLSRSA